MPLIDSLSPLRFSYLTVFNISVFGINCSNSCLTMESVRNCLLVLALIITYSWPIYSWVLLIFDFSLACDNDSIFSLFLVSYLNLHSIFNLEEDFEFSNILICLYSHLRKFCGICSHFGRHDNIKGPHWKRNHPDEKETGPYFLKLGDNPKTGNDNVIFVLNAM